MCQPADAGINQDTAMQRHPTLNRMAEVTGKSTATIHRWQKTNPELYRAVVEYVARIDKNEEK